MLVKEDNSIEDVIYVQSSVETCNKVIDDLLWRNAVSYIIKVL